MAKKTKGKKGKQGKGKVTALSEILSAGVTKLDNGDYQISAKTAKAMRSERLRRMTVSGVPNAPRHLTRDGGGVGVARGSSRGGVASNEALRAIRARGPIFQVIHNARAYQVRQMAQKWDGIKGHVGWKVVHKDHVKNSEVPSGFQPFIDRFENMLERPAPSYKINTTSALLMGLEEDLLTINRPTVEVLHSLLDPERVVGFRPVDGAIIWPTLVWLEKWKADTPGWSRGYNAESLSERDQLDLASHALGADLLAARHCLVRDGILEAVYPAHKIIVAPIQNRTDINHAGYPPSHVEMALEMGVGFINAWDYNANYFTRGMLAEFALGISGDVHDDDVAAFADMLREATQGVSKAWQPPIIPLHGDGDLKKIDLKQSNTDMMYDIWMSLTIALAAAIYRMDPTTINAKPWDGGGSPSLSAPNRNMEIALAKEEGLQGDLGHLVDNVLTPLARRAHPDLRVMMEYGDHDPEKEARIYEIRARVDMTRNEVRIEQGLPPRGFWVEDDKYDGLSDEDTAKYDDNMWNMPADPTFVNAYQQAKEMESMGEEGEGEGDGFGEMGGAQASPAPTGDGVPAPQASQPTTTPPKPSTADFPFGKLSEGMTKAVRDDGSKVTVYVHDIER